MQVDLITRDDLYRMKRDILKEIKDILAIQSKEQVQWIKSTEVREILKISAGTLQTMRLNGTIPYSKLGGVLYYAKADIEQLLKENKIQNK